MLTQILFLLIDTIAGLLAGILLLRFWMQAIRVRPPNSIAQFLYQLTDWLVLPLRRVLPGFGGYDWACLVGAFLIAFAAVAAHFLITPFFPIQTVLIVAVARVLQWILYGFMGLLILEVIFSWVNPQAPLAPFVRALNDPFMRPLRRVIPPVGNVDLSPLAAFILLQIGLYLINGLLRSAL